MSLKTNKVTSTKTPLQYDYYDLPFCKKRKSKSRAENIGERISGDSVTSSPYEVSLRSVIYFGHVLLIVCSYE